MADSDRIRATEDALLDMHEECKLARLALRRQAEAVQKAQRQLADERHAATKLRHAAGMAVVQGSVADALVQVTG